MRLQRHVKRRAKNDNVRRVNIDVMANFKVW